MSEQQKTPSDVLELIRVLTPNEKRAFTLSHMNNAKTGEKDKKNFMLLFEAMNEFDGDDEEEFKSRHLNAPFMKQYNWTKSHLFEQILDAMQVQRIRNPAGEDGSLEFGARSELDHAKFLVEKRLRKAGLKRTRKAANMAREYEFHEVLLEILRFERTLLLQSQEKDYEMRLHELHSEIEALVQTIDNKYRILGLKDRFFILYRRRSNALLYEESREIDNLFDDPLIQDPALAKSFDARTNQVSAQAIYHLLRRDLDQAWEYQRLLYLMWAGSKTARAARPVAYRNVIFNYLNISSDVRDYRDFDVAMKEMQDSPFVSEEERIEVENNVFLLKLQYSLDQMELDEAVKLESGYKAILKKDPDRMSPSRQMVMALGFARLRFVLGDSKGTAQWIQVLLGFKSPNIRTDIQDFTWMLQIMACYDADNHDLLENICRNALRYFARQQNPPEFSRIALKEIAKVAEILPEEHIQHFRNLYATLSRMALDPIEKHSLGLHTVIYWLQSKNEGCGIREVLERMHADPTLPKEVPSY